MKYDVITGRQDLVGSRTEQQHHFLSSGLEAESHVNLPKKKL